MPPLTVNVYFQMVSGRRFELKLKQEIALMSHHRNYVVLLNYVHFVVGNICFAFGPGVYLAIDNTDFHLLSFSLYEPSHFQQREGICKKYIILFYLNFLLGSCF